MKKSRKLLAIVLSTVIAVSLAVAVKVRADGVVNNTFEARLNGFSQVPSIITSGTGRFNAALASDGASISYTLSYSGLSSMAHVAHIHVGQRGVNGNVIVFLCGGGGKPDCPALSGTVTGTLTSADVQSIPTQGVASGDFRALLTAIHAGVSYVNVHTTNFPGGEIRGQIGGAESSD
jgi:hypothetical protein